MMINDEVKMKREMKIVHLGHVPTPNDHPQRKFMGWVHPGRWVLNHAIAQKQAGMDVEVVTQVYKAKEDFVCEIEGVKVHFLRTLHPCCHFTFHAINQFRIASYVKRLKPTIVHAHGTESAYTLAALRTKLPFCVTAQGLMFQIMQKVRKVDIHTRFIRIAEHYAWRRTRYAIAKSKYVLEGLKGEYPNIDYTEIHNTYEPTLGLEISCEKNSMALAYAGSFNERKGIHLIAEAIEEISKKYPNMKLHMMGNPKEEVASGYAKEQIERLRTTLGERLHLHGVLPSKELFKVLDGCVALLAPSYEDMFGNQVIEGLMRGCHVIMTEEMGAAEVTRDSGNATLIPVGDAGALARGITAVLEHTPTKEAIEQGRARVKAEMSPEAVAEKHRMLYEKIIDTVQRTTGDNVQRITYN